MVYEAGPCGYALARELVARGYRCEVVAPSKIPRRRGARQDRSARCADLAGLPRAGELVAVAIPDERDEAMRDLSRARLDAVRARLKARQQLKALLLRHGRATAARLPGRRPTSAIWPRCPSSTPPRTSPSPSTARRSVRGKRGYSVLTQALARRSSTGACTRCSSALMTLRGVDLIAATSVVAELGDLQALCPSARTDGLSGTRSLRALERLHARLGAITKTGNAHVRRVLIEAAWNYRFPARISRTCSCARRASPRDPRVAWRAQLRLTHRYRRLNARGLQHNKSASRSRANSPVLSGTSGGTLHPCA